MKSKLVFESDDGVLFDSEDECREWEVVRERIKRFYARWVTRLQQPLVTTLSLTLKTAVRCGLGDGS